MRLLTIIASANRLKESMLMLHGHWSSAVAFACVALWLVGCSIVMPSGEEVVIPLGSLTTTFSGKSEVEALCDEGLALTESAEYDKAIEAFDSAIELAPNYAPAYFYRGSAHGYMGRYEQAVEDYGLAIELDPNLEAAYCNRADIHVEVGNFDHAIQDLWRAADASGD